MVLTNYYCDFIDLPGYTSAGSSRANSENCEFTLSAQCVSR